MRESRERFERASGKLRLTIIISARALNRADKISIATRVEAIKILRMTDKIDIKITAKKSKRRDFASSAPRLPRYATHSALKAMSQWRAVASSISPSSLAVEATS